MDITASLQDLGLTEKEATIYTTLLQLGRGSILDIAHHCSLKRPTIYSGIESLENKGLVHRIPLGKRIQFQAEPPEQLSQLVERHQKQLNELLPQLLAITNVPRGTKPEIRFFEGKESVTTLYKHTFGNLVEHESVYFITSARDLYANFPEMLQLFKELSHRREWKVREIVPNTSAGVQYVSDVSMRNTRHQVRFLPKGLDLFDMEVMLVRDALILVSFRQDIFALSIKSKHFVDSFQNIFKGLWMISQEPLHAD